MKMAVEFMLAFVLLAPPALSLLAEYPILTTTGALIGKTESYNGTIYHSFRGIPYAEPPVGELRFKAPLPKSQWSGILNASEYGHVCPQVTTQYQAEQQSEDCLFLNVFVPKGGYYTPLPVLFFITGGYFHNRSGDDSLTGPQLLMQSSDIIVVTVNYRLGALGFLNLNLPEASGNAALKDLVIAFKWIHDNIEYFSGDPTRITIGGQSSGSTLAYYLTILPQLQGLIKGGIYQSGSPLNYRHRMLQPLKTAFELASAVNIDTNDTAILLEELKNKDPIELANAVEIMGNSDVRKGLATYAPFLPSIEIDVPDALVTKSIIEIIEDGNNADIPVIMGYTSDESLNFATRAKNNHTLIDLLNEDFQRCIPLDVQLEFSYDSEKSLKFAKEMRNFYFEGKNITTLKWHSHVNFASDMNYAHSKDYTARLHKLTRKNAKIFYYYFNYDGELNNAKIANNITIPGTMHADDYGYIFSTFATRNILPHIKEETKRMTDIFQKIIVNFVIHGNPTPEGSGLDFTWNEMLYPEMNQLILNTNPYMKPHGPIRNRLNFWDKIYNDYYRISL